MILRWLTAEPEVFEEHAIENASDPPDKALKLAPIAPFAGSRIETVYIWWRLFLRGGIKFNRIIGLIFLFQFYPLKRNAKTLMRLINNNAE
jgi:hypothetical protein